MSLTRQAKASAPAKTTGGPTTGTVVVVTLLSALALVMAGIGAGWLFWGQTAEQSETATVPNAQASGVVGEEPVATVAAALLPSVVQIENSEGLGSGFVYDAGGLILTAAHVVGSDETVTVRLANGDQLSADVVGADAGSDIAVVRVDHDELSVAPLAVDSSVLVGQTAVALGSPYGLDQTVTAGIVSAVDRALVGSDGVVRNVIQTDTAINPGNSGGPLSDLSGQVIGINDSIFSESGGNEGVGFAIPITVAKHVADLLVSGEPIEVAFLGVSGTDPAEGELGVVVAEVVTGSPADAAGVMVGDLITSVDGVRVEGMVELAAQVRAHVPDEEVAVELMRGGEALTLTVTLGSND